MTVDLGCVDAQCIILMEQCWCAVACGYGEGLAGLVSIVSLW